MLNVFCYILVTYLFFSVLFLSDTRELTSITSLQLPSSFSLFKNLIIILLLMLAGTPPFIIFCGKFFILAKLCKVGNLFLGFFVVFFNLVVMYFYIQNLRLLVFKKSKSFFIFKNNFIFIPRKLLDFIFVVSFLTLSFVFFIQDLYIFCLLLLNSFI